MPPSCKVTVLRGACDETLGSELAVEVKVTSSEVKTQIRCIVSINWTHSWKDMMPRGLTEVEASGRLFAIRGQYRRPGEPGVCGTRGTHDLCLIFLLLRLRRRTRFFLHLALILNNYLELARWMQSMCNEPGSYLVRRWVFAWRLKKGKMGSWGSRGGLNYKYLLGSPGHEGRSPVGYVR